MADKCDLCLLGLIILSSLLTGTSGGDYAHVFIGSSENARLHCNNALSDCKSTTWLYYSFGNSTADKLIGLGIKKKEIETHERLSLGSDCSLNIKNVTKEDNGLFTCQQYVNDKQQGTNAYVYLHVLHVSVSPSSSSSSSQTEISPGRSVTLSCQFYSRLSCDRWLRFEGLQLLWVNQAGVDLMTDSRYQILFSSDHCIITLTTTLLNEDDNREWRCQLTHRNQLKTSVRYTVRYSDDVSEHSSSAADSTILISVSSSDSEKKSIQITAAAPTLENQKSLNTPNSERTAAVQTPVFTEQQDPADTASETEVSVTAETLFRVIVVIVEIAVFAAPTVILLQIICARRAGNRKNSDHPEEIVTPSLD